MKPLRLQEFTFVKSGRNRYTDCEAKNGTMVLSTDFVVLDSGTNVKSGKDKLKFVI